MILDTIDSCMKLKDISNKTVFIAGAGSRGILIGRFFSEIGLHWSGYIDKKIYNVDLNGKKIFTYEDTDLFQDSYFVISSVLNKDEIQEQLYNRGVSAQNIMILNDACYNEIANYMLGGEKVEEEIVKIKQFKGIYAGERCFLIGNGPSLEVDDLEKLKDEITFACNSIFRLFNSTDWRPTYYFIHDEKLEYKVFPNGEEWKKNICAEVKMAFTSVQSRAFFYRNEWGLKNLYYYKRIPIVENEFPFSEDPSRCIYTSGTIAYAMLQMAAYMGFTEIYMLGFDTNYAIERKRDGTILYNDVKNHHDLMKVDDETAKQISAKDANICHDVESMIQGYRSAKKYAEEHDISIINVTRGGKLDIFQRKSFDEIVKGR